MPAEWRKRGPSRAGEGKTSCLSGFQDPRLGHAERMGVQAVACSPEG